MAFSFDFSSMALRGSRDPCKSFDDGTRPFVGAVYWRKGSDALEPPLDPSSTHLECSDISNESDFSADAFSFSSEINPRLDPGFFRPPLRMLRSFESSSQSAVAKKFTLSALFDLPTPLVRGDARGESTEASPRSIDFWRAIPRVGPAPLCKAAVICSKSSPLLRRDTCRAPMGERKSAPPSDDLARATPRRAGADLPPPLSPSSPHPVKEDENTSSPVSIFELRLDRGRVCDAYDDDPTDCVSSGEVRSDFERVRRIFPRLSLGDFCRELSSTFWPDVSSPMSTFEFLRATGRCFFDNDADPTDLTSSFENTFSLDFDRWIFPLLSFTEVLC